MKRVVNAYRKAAKELFKANDTEAARYILDPKDDTGENAPNSLCIIYLEPNFTFPEDTGCIPYKLDYWSRNGHENCILLAGQAGIGWIEYINAAVAAVYE